MQTILVAGGTGLLGKYLIDHFTQKGFKTIVLTRNKQLQSGSLYWNPTTKEIDTQALQSVTHIINLTGENIAKRWTKSYKKRLLSSRTKPADFLFSLREFMPNLQHYISASGINSYPIQPSNHAFSEEEAFGSDYLSQLCKDWERHAQQFEAICPVTILRISVVITPTGGAVAKMLQPMQVGFGQAIATGNQRMNWIHVDDLVRMFEHVIVHQLTGVYNTNAGTATNQSFTKALAHAHHKKFLTLPIPAWCLRVVFGQMSEMLTEGVEANHAKIKATGFHFEQEALITALKK